jgi:hypothetical protein
MNGMTPPVYHHADLLHPARRLWKRVLPGCSQAEIETRVLGLDRSGDTPGALAPDIWFSFLKSGAFDALLGVCDHNQKDIFGLASILALLVRIAVAPLETLELYPYDLEGLALRWREALRRLPVLGDGEGRTGAALMEAARVYPKAALVGALDLLRHGSAEEGRQRLLALAQGDFPDEIRARGFRALAIDAKWHLRDRTLALGYIEAGLTLNIRDSLRRDLRSVSFRGCFSHGKVTVL